MSWNTMSVRIGAVLCGASVAVLAPLCVAAVTFAQAQQPAPKPGPAAPQTAPAAPAGPVKTETTAFDNWVLTCQEAPPAAGAKAGRRTCWGSMRISDTKTNRVVLVWKVGRDGKDVPTIAITTPTGVLVREGVDVAIGQNVRRLAYQSCGPNDCEASIAYDQAFANDLSANREAVVSFYVQDGRKVSVKVGISGVDKVLAGLKKG